MKNKIKSIVNVICNRYIFPSEQCSSKTISVYSGVSVKAFVYTGFSISIDYFTQFVLSVVFVLFRAEIPNELQFAFIEKLGYPPAIFVGLSFFMPPPPQ